jgi:hypothetical protein
MPALYLSILVEHLGFLGVNNVVDEISSIRVQYQDRIHLNIKYKNRVNATVHPYTRK